MPTETTTILTPRTHSQQVYTQSEFCPPGTSFGSSTDNSFEFLRSVDALPDSRPKPAEPLWKSLTAQPKQSTEIIRKSLLAARYGYERAWYNCELGQPQKLGWLIVDHLSTPGGPKAGTSLEVPDWITPLRLKIVSERQNLGESLVEYRDTVNMFRRFARGAYSAWKRARGRMPRRRRLSVCDAATAHLTLEYGVKPLARDLYEAVNRLSDRTQKPLMRRYVVTKENSEERTTEGDWTFEGLETVSARAIVYVEFDIDHGDFFIENPGSLAWNAIPYSFVIDWALPIGDYLLALDAYRGVNDVKGTLTVKRESYVRNAYFVRGDPDIQPPTGPPTLPVGKPYAEATLSLEPSFHSYSSHERSVLTEIPLPPLPRWDPSASWKRLANASALLYSLLQGCNHPTRD